MDPVQALTGASNALDLGVTATDATASPEASPETYVIKGTDGAYQDPKAKLIYFQKPDNTVSLAWRVETDLYSNWLLSYVDAEKSEEVFGVVDYTADASYQV